MVHFFIESKNDSTPEYVFLEEYIKTVRPDLKFHIVPMDGLGNLFNNSITTMMRLHSSKQEKNIVIVDTDYPENNGGFAYRSKSIADQARTAGLTFELFLFPNNSADGIFENLLESIAQTEKHKLFFDCFSDYENCMKSQKDANGKPIYQVPNLKGKLHTYITAVPMPQKLRKNLGRGNWQFENKDYWDMDSSALEPLRNFLLKI